MSGIFLATPWSIPMLKHWGIWVAFLYALAYMGIATAFADSQKGKISYYSEGSHTSSWERYNKRDTTCAHPRVPFGTQITIHIRGRKASCRVNDRGPFKPGRILDVSVRVAEELGLTRAGVLPGTITW